MTAAFNLSGRLALSVGEACEALGIGHDHWQEHVMPQVRIVRAGRRKLVPVTELQRWLDEHAEHVLPPGTGKSPPANVPGAGARASRAPRSTATRTRREEAG